MSRAIGVDRFPSHLTPAPATGHARKYTLPSPSSHSPSPPPVLGDDSLPFYNDHSDDNDDDQRVLSFSISEPISPLKGQRPTRNCRLTHAVNPPTLPTKRNARKADPIKAILRERNREARAGGGIEALNRAEGYDPDTLLSNFSIEAEEPVDTTRSRLADENTTRVLPASLQTDDVGADIAANTLEDDVQQDDRERLLGAKEGEAVGKILDADRKMGQTAAHGVSGVSVFVSDYERTVDAELCTGARLEREWARDNGKAATLQMLDEAIEHQGARDDTILTSLSNRMQLDIEYLQAVFAILNADDMAVPGVAQWLCEQGTYHPGLTLAWMLIVTSFMVWGRACRTIQPEVPPRDATMGSVLSGFATVCGHPCANHDAFGTAQAPEHACATTKRCNYYTPSEPTYGLTFDGKVDCIVCSVSPVCYCIWWHY